MYAKDCTAETAPSRNEGYLYLNQRLIFRGRFGTLQYLQYLLMAWQTWSLMRLVILGLGGIVAEQFGIQAVYYAGGALLAAAGLLGLVLSPRYAFKEGGEVTSTES